MSRFVDVILPLPLQGTFTYSIPEAMEECVAPGCRVKVPLGKSKSYTALVASVHDTEPEGYEIRPITEILDEAPIILDTQIKL